MARGATMGHLFAQSNESNYRTKCASAVLQSQLKSRVYHARLVAGHADYGARRIRPPTW